MVREAMFLYVCASRPSILFILSSYLRIGHPRVLKLDLHAGYLATSWSTGLKRASYL